MSTLRAIASVGLPVLDVGRTERVIAAATCLFHHHGPGSHQRLDHGPDITGPTPTISALASATASVGTAAAAVPGRSRRLTAAMDRVRG
jgi:hypothetical protein